MSRTPSPFPSEQRYQAMSPALQYVPPEVTPGPSPSHDDEWSIVNTTDNEEFSMFQTSGWLSEEPSGLGLLESDTTAHSTLSVAPGLQPNPPDIRYNWSPNPATPESSSTRNTPLRKDSANESCDPLSTLLPGTWDLRSRSLAYNTSPAPSDGSMSSYPSAMSSPYALSVGYMRISEPPFIKIEESVDDSYSSMYSFPETALAEQSLLVNPNDLFNEPVASIEDRVRMSLAPSLPQGIGEWKPPISHLRRQRARSFDDVFEEMSKDRKKRAPTTSENANCSCAICGKLFRRTYNLKAHLETHNPARSKSHECLYDGCGKMFARSMDLKRHQDSVSE